MRSLKAQVEDKNRIVNKLYAENAQLKQRIKEHVTDANNQTSEIVRLRVIAERAKSHCKKYTNWLNYKTVIKILDEAGKGEGNLRRDGG